MKKKCEIIPLPTEKANRTFVSVNGELRLEKGVYNYPKGLYPTSIGYHLYLISDDVIKENCWCIDLSSGEIKLFQGDVSSKYEYAGYRKIVATTDTMLEKLCGCQSNCGAKKSLLPTFPEEFIKTYVEAGGIDDVMVEYETLMVALGGTDLTSREVLKVGADNTVIISEERKLDGLSFSDKIPKVGDKVAVFMHNGNPEEVFEIVIGTLTRLDEEPFGSIDNKEVVFASEGHTSFVRVIEKIIQIPCIRI